MKKTNSSTTRRAVLQAGAAAAGIAWLARVGAAERKEKIIRKIPATGEPVPVIGIGTSNFKEVSDVKAVLARMSQLGGSVIDTGALYGNVEEMIGTALAELGIRDKMFVETKFNVAGVGFGGLGPVGARAGAPTAGNSNGAPPPSSSAGAAAQSNAQSSVAVAAATTASPDGSRAPRFSPPADSVGGLESFERSLNRLRTDHVDLLMAHLMASWEPLADVMIEQKQRGRARYIGVTTASPNQHAPLVEFMRKHPIDFIQVDYSLDNRIAAEDVFPVAMERKIAVMVAVPFGGRFNQLLKKTAGVPLPAWTADFDANTWAQVLLKYSISHPAVTCVVPGATKVAHIEDNLAAGMGRLPDAKARKKLEDYWDHLMADKSPQ